MSRDDSEKKEKVDKEKAIEEMNERFAKSKEKASEAADDIGREVTPVSILEASNLKEEAKAWECLSCHTVNNETSKICSNCGQIKAMGYKNISLIYCNSCGAMLNSSAKFCHVCGSKVSES